MVDDSSLVRGDRSSGSPASGPGRAENEGGSDAVTQARGAAILTPARILLIVGGLAVLAAGSVIAVALVAAGDSMAWRAASSCN